MILVLGAGGKTGTAVTYALVRRGIPVRAAVRPGSTHRGLDHRLVTPVEVDLESGLGLAAAVDGVAGVYHLAPNVHPDEVGMAARVAEAAARAGVARFAFHSVLHPDDASMPHHVRKGEAEAVVRGLHPSATILRPGAYHQNLLGAALSGRIVVPYSLDVPFTPVDLDDVAEVAAVALAGELLAGETMSLIGPQRLTVREQAEVAAQVRRSPVTVETISLDDWVTGPGARLTPAAREDLLAMFRAYDRDGFADQAEALGGVLGRPPTTWAAAVAAAAARSDAGPRRTWHD